MFDMNDDELVVEIASPDLLKTIQDVVDRIVAAAKARSVSTRGG
jgi:hypothetical protein